jgi:serine/threonine-protein kinase
LAIKCPKCHTVNPDAQKFCGECATPLPSAEEISVSQTKTFLTPTKDPIKGTTFAGRYQLIEELGRGGMGVVYKAEDTKLKRTVALKFLPPELTHIPDVKDRFMREAQAAAALDHPNICTVYEFDEAEEKTFISMAYVEGQSLRKKIESGPLELDEALWIATQVAQGLQIAHKKGIVHRDIKSANIMVDDRNQAKIMDFGLARMTGGTLLTQEGTAMGTIAYMSPEQAQGEEVDQRTDIWSFGVVLYEMLTGELPFKGEHEQAVVYSIRKDKPRPVTEINAEIPPSIEQVLDKALEKDADKRYQQVDDLLDDLKSISVGIVPEEIKARLRKEKLRKRKRAILYAGAAGLIIILAVLGLTLLKGPPETIDSIAVLPLENLTGDAEQEYFVDGVTDELIGQLGQISGLQRVISRTSVMRYKNTEKSLPEIAREMNVDALVEGAVYQVGENVSIKLQLFDALPQERSLWTQRYDRPITDVLVMYGEMAGAIAENIKVKLTAQEETRLAGARQVNPEAHEAYLRGMYYLLKVTPGDFDTAEKYFDLALEKDPSFAPAYAGRAWLWLYRNQTGMASPEEAVPKVKAAAQRALELDANSADAHHVLASVKTYLDWDWEGAEESWERTLELNPNIASAQGLYAHFLAITGHVEKAMIHSEKAAVLDPFNPLVQSLHAQILMVARRYDEAIAVARETQRIHPDHPIVGFTLWMILHEKKGMEEAFEAIKAYIVAIYQDPRLEAALEEGYAHGGYAEAMKRGAESLIARLPEAFSMPNDIGNFYLAAGEKDKAIEWFGQGLEVHDPVSPYLSCFPIYDDIRPDPRIQDLLRKMNLPVDEKE